VNILVKKRSWTEISERARMHKKEEIFRKIFILALLENYNSTLKIDNRSMEQDITVYKQT